MNTKGKKWFATLRLQGKSLQCQLDSGATCNVMSYEDKVKGAPHTLLRPSNVKLRLYSGESLDSMGVLDTACVIKGVKYQLSFEIVETSQGLSGSTCEHLGLMQFTIPDDVLKMEQVRSEPLTKEHLIEKYSDVFNLPVISLPGEVNFELDPSVAPVQSSPRNVPIAMKADVLALLDLYQAEGHITDITEPTVWIRNMETLSLYNANFRGCVVQTA